LKRKKEERTNVFDILRRTTRTSAQSIVEAELEAWDFVLIRLEVVARTGYMSGREERRGQKGRPQENDHGVKKLRMRTAWRMRWLSEGEGHEGGRDPVEEERNKRADELGRREDKLVEQKAVYCSVGWTGSRVRGVHVRAVLPRRSPLAVKIKISLESLDSRVHGRVFLGLGVLWATSQEWRTMNSWCAMSSKLGEYAREAYSKT
jgi:hypothetical protein